MIIKKNSQKFRDDLKIEDSENSESIVEDEIQVILPEKNDEKYHALETKEEPIEIDIFNLEHIDFKQRQERRRGDRRRGYRRTDDRNLISRAKDEANSIKEAAIKEGYEAGLHNAKADVDEVKDAIKEFIGAKQEVFDYIAPYIMNISLDIAKKIIKKEVKEDPMLILDNIAEVLKKLSKEETKITLKVNPMQVSLVRTEIPEIVSNTGLDAKIMIIPDESIMEGGCMVTTTNGVIDATIETQLSVISEALKEL